jgi:hypothetical protein
VYNQNMIPVHRQVLDAALALTGAGGAWDFRLADVVRALPHLNAGTVRTHVASRCCVNAPSHHQSRHPYFRSVGRGIYRIESAFRRKVRSGRSPVGAWYGRALSTIDSGVDPTLIAASLKRSPTERLEQMQHAAESLDAMTAR